MKRRKFILTVVAATAAVASIPVIRYRCRSSIPGDPLLRPQVLAHFCDEEEIRRIGTHYRANIPAENGKNKLTDLILREKNGKRTTLSDNEALSKWIDQKVREDFKEERTVIVDGWILSETEARQCALLTFGDN